MPKSSRNRTGGEKISPRMELAAFKLASGGYNAEAAEAANVGTPQVKRWLALPHFRRRITALRAEMSDHALGVLASNCYAATVRLVEVLCNPDPKLQLKAANSILDKMLRFTELLNHEQRIRDLEEAADKPAPFGPRRAV